MWARLATCILTMQCYGLPEGLEVCFHRWASLSWWISPAGGHHGQPRVGPTTPVWWCFAAQKADKILPTNGSPTLLHPGQHVLQSNTKVIHPSVNQGLIVLTNTDALFCSASTPLLCKPNVVCKHLVPKCQTNVTGRCDSTISPDTRECRHVTKR